MLVKQMKDIILLPLGIYLVKERAIVISDLHIGYEEYLFRRGIQMPRTSYAEIKEVIFQYILITKAEHIILNGDLKEQLARFSYQEKSELSDFIFYLNSFNIKISFVRGNHDNFLANFLLDRGVDLYEKFFELGDNFITHGHIKLEEEIKKSKAKRVIIGHEHATVNLIDEVRSSHKFKVIAEADIFDKKIFVLPAFSPIKMGCELNRKDKFLSPILSMASNFKIYLYEDEEWFFFKLEDIYI